MYSWPFSTDDSSSLYVAGGSVQQPYSYSVSIPHIYSSKIPAQVRWWLWYYSICPCTSYPLYLFLLHCCPLGFPLHIWLHQASRNSNFFIRPWNKVLERNRDSFYTDRWYSTFGTDQQHWFWNWPARWRWWSWCPRRPPQPGLPGPHCPSQCSGTSRTVDAFHPTITKAQYSEGTWYTVKI